MHFIFDPFRSLGTFPQLYPYIPGRHTLLLRGARWDNGRSLCQAGGEQEEGAGEHWPSWTHWLCWAWKQPWSSFSSLPFHLHQKEEVRESLQIRKRKKIYEIMRSCSYRRTNVFSRETLFDANIRLQIRSDSPLEQHRRFQTTCQWAPACQRSHREAQGYLMKSSLSLINWLKRLKSP